MLLYFPRLHWVQLVVKCVSSYRCEERATLRGNKRTNSLCGTGKKYRVRIQSQTSDVLNEKCKKVEFILIHVKKCCLYIYNHFICFKLYNVLTGKITCRFQVKSIVIHPNLLIQLQVLHLNKKLPGANPEKAFKPFYLNQQVHYTKNKKILFKTNFCNTKQSHKCRHTRNHPTVLNISNGYTVTHGDLRI